MKKRVLFAAVSLSLMALISGCGGDDAPPEDATSEAVALTTSPESQSNPSSSVEDVSFDVVDYGYSVSEKQYLYCSVILRNSNADFCIKYPAYRVTARDSSGVVLGSREITLGILYPQQDLYDADQAFKVDEAPATVEVEVIQPKDYQIITADQAAHDTYIPLSAVNCVVRDNNVMGEIVNNNDYMVDSAKVTVVFMNENGDLQGGDYTVINQLSPGASVPFSLSVKDAGTITDHFVVSANLI